MSQYGRFLSFREELNKNIVWSIKHKSYRPNPGNRTISKGDLVHLKHVNVLYHFSLVKDSFLEDLDPLVDPKSMVVREQIDFRAKSILHDQTSRFLSIPQEIEAKIVWSEPFNSYCFKFSDLTEKLFQLHYLPDTNTYVSLDEDKLNPYEIEEQKYQQSQIQNQITMPENGDAPPGQQQLGAAAPAAPVRLSDLPYFDPEKDLKVKDFIKSFWGFIFNNSTELDFTEGTDAEKITKAKRCAKFLYQACRGKAGDWIATKIDVSDLSTVTGDIMKTVLKELQNEFSGFSTIPRINLVTWETLNYEPPHEIDSFCHEVYELGLALNKPISDILLKLSMLFSKKYPQSYAVLKNCITLPQIKQEMLELMSVLGFDSKGVPKVKSVNNPQPTNTSQNVVSPGIVPNKTPSQQPQSNTPQFMGAVMSSGNSDDKLDMQQELLTQMCIMNSNLTDALQCMVQNFNQNDRKGRTWDKNSDRFRDRKGRAFNRRMDYQDYDKQQGPFRSNRTQYREYVRSPSYSPVKYRNSSRDYNRGSNRRVSPEPYRNINSYRQPSPYRNQSPAGYRQSRYRNGSPAPTSRQPRYDTQPRYRNESPNVAYRPRYESPRRDFSPQVRYQQRIQGGTQQEPVKQTNQRYDGSPQRVSQLNQATNEKLSFVGKQEPYRHPNHTERTQLSMEDTYCESNSLNCQT